MLHVDIRFGCLFLTLFDFIFHQFVIDENQYNVKQQTKPCNIQQNSSYINLAWPYKRYSISKQKTNRYMNIASSELNLEPKWKHSWASKRYPLKVEHPNDTRNFHSPSSHFYKYHL